jgi:hypothetical protein
VLLVAKEGCPGFPITKADMCEAAKKKKEVTTFWSVIHERIEVSISRKDWWVQAEKTCVINFRISMDRE